MLVLRIRKGEGVQIGDDIMVMLAAPGVNGGAARIGVMAPKTLEVRRLTERDVNDHRSLPEGDRGLL